MKKMIPYQIACLCFVCVIACIVILLKTQETVYGIPAVVAETAIVALSIWMVCLFIISLSEKKSFSGWIKYIPQLFFSLILLFFLKSYLGNLLLGASATLLLLGIAGLIAGFFGERIIVPATNTAFAAFMAHILFRFQFIPETPHESIIIIFLVLFISSVLLALLSQEEFKNQKINKIELADSLAIHYLSVFLSIPGLFFIIYI